MLSEEKYAHEWIAKRYFDFCSAINSIYKYSKPFNLPFLSCLPSFLILKEKRILDSNQDEACNLNLMTTFPLKISILQQIP